MAGTRYVPIEQGQMEQLLQTEMGFTRADEGNCWEMIWVRDVVTTSGHAFPYQIKVYSTIDIRTKMSRDSGTDAIRVVLMDKVTGYPVKSAEKKVLRTKSALINTRERARELFRHVLEGPHCPKCSALMVKRKAGPEQHEFWGCTHYAPKNTYHCNGTRKVEK